MKFGVIVAARTGSSRLPGKALLELGGRPMIVFLLERLMADGPPAPVVLATTRLTRDNRLAEVATGLGVPVFRGENGDVVRRFVNAAEAHGMEYVVRVTGDCPFVDRDTLAACLASCKTLGDFDLVTTKGAFPVGIDFEIYRVDVMRELDAGGELNLEDREHLTKFLYDHPQRFSIEQLKPPASWPTPARTFTVDTADDYAFAREMVRRLGGATFSVQTLLEEACRET